MPLIRLCATDELPPPGAVRELSAAGHALCVANVDGRVCALDNVCPHRGGPLSEGMIEDGKVVCPWHAWEFDPTSGECLTVAGNAVKTYPVSSEGEDVFVQT